MNKSEQLTIGMPAGSLADPKRGGNLVNLLEKAGFRTKGYDAGGPTAFRTVNYLFGWDGRPQEFGSQMALGEIDVAIAGDDWIQERRLEMEIEYNQTITLEKVLSMQRGGVRIVGIAANDNPADTIDALMKTLTAEKKLITVVSEMPFMALDWLRKVLERIGKREQYENWSVQKYKTPPKIDSGIVIYETWGKTEAKVKNGGADLGIEITQSGSALRNYGLKIVDEIMTSETGIWINPRIRENSAKFDLLKMFLLNLYGTINAEGKFLLLFNVPNAMVEKVNKFLADHNLFADEPTVNPGKSYAQYSIQVDEGSKDIPLAEVRYRLACLGATSIDTMPLLSSIPDEKVLQL